MAQTNPHETAVITGKKEKPVKIRILADITITGETIKAGRVVSIDTKSASELVDKGVADDNAAAVDFALTEYPDIIEIA